MSDARESTKTRPVNVNAAVASRRLRAVGYARVSTEHQLDGFSLGWQEEQVRGAVDGHGWELVGVLTEQASGKSLRSRPVLRGLLEQLDAGEVDVLVVAKLDRLARSMLDFYSLLERAKRRDWAVVCLSPALDMTSPQGRMVAGMSMLFAEYEREIMGDRQRESIAARKAVGSYVPPPRLVTADAEERIAFLTSEGMGPRRIARQLELEGFEPPAGRRWYPTSVARIAARQRAA
jgi:DNA invertase Pin-like site-specific DNA recombinase